MRNSFGALSVVCFLVNFACATADANEPAPSRPPSEFVAGNNRFALDLYQQLAKKSDGSLCFSPYSVSTALAMTYAGAKGDTADQMAKTLHFTVPPDQLHASFGAMLNKLKTGDPNHGFQFHVANRLWGQRGAKFLPGFLQVTKDNYGAELGPLDFVGQPEAARATINDWVARQTNDKIKDLVPSGAVSADTRLVLANAIYFNAAWLLPFDESLTAKGPFHRSAMESVDVDFMHHQAMFGYRSTEKLQVLEMPYGTTGLTMVILLPNQIDGLSDLEKSLTAEAVDGWLQKLMKPDVMVMLPKFKVTQEANLRSTLSALGMPLAFSPTQADFSGMDGGHDLFLSAVLHKVYIDVNEKGTEAAAATAALVALAEAPPHKVESFKADRPFLFLIRGASSGSIFFMGRYTGPAK